MNKKIFVFIFVLVSFAHSAWSQSLGIIRGVVKDKNTQETIVGATIVIDGTTDGAVTDVEGAYKISVPVGTYRLKASFLGYTTLWKENIVVTTGNAQILNFEMEQMPNQLGAVEIVFEKV